MLISKAPEGLERSAEPVPSRLFAWEIRSGSPMLALLTEPRPGRIAEFLYFVEFVQSIVCEMAQRTPGIVVSYYRTIHLDSGRLSPLGVRVLGSRSADARRSLLCREIEEVAASQNSASFLVAPFSATSSFIRSWFGALFEFAYYLHVSLLEMILIIAAQPRSRQTSTPVLPSATIALPSLVGHHVTILQRSTRRW